MHTTHFIIIFFSILLSFTAVASAQKPNIVVIMSDDAGFTDLGSFGGEIDTPHLDQLAKSGVRFNAFYSNARCSPTRATLLTGVDAAHVGFGGGVVGDWVRELPFAAHRGRLPYKQPLISELLADNGYQTMMVGKWHLGGSYIKDQPALEKAWRDTHPPSMKLTDTEKQLDYLALPPQRGFQKSFVFHGAQGNLFYVPNDAHEYYEGNEKATLKYKYDYKMHCFSATPYNKKRYGKCHGKKGKNFHATDSTTDRAIEMINAAAKNTSPFFLYMAYRAPHKPLQAPEYLVQKYLKKYTNLQKIADDRHAGLVKQSLFPENAGIRNSNYMWTEQSPEKIEKYRLQAAIHAAMMEKLDENVGKLIQTLKNNGVYENTLVLYFSDNGAASHIGDLMNAPYAGVKALLWEGGMRTHALATWPRVIPPGTITNDVVWVGDLFPTFLEITDTEFPSKFRDESPRLPDGRSILPTLKGDEMASPNALFFNDKGQQSIIYQGRWKLLIEAGWYLQTLKKPGISYELYDLNTDPGETNNIATEHPKLVEKLEKMLDAWRVENKIVDYADIIKIKPKDPY